MIRRPGQISAWENEDFVAAVKSTGRKNRIMAGVTVEVCLAYSNAKIIGSSEATQPETAVEEREVLLRSTREEEIRNRAYEIHLQRGGQPGYEVEDWLQAERELTK